MVLLLMASMNAQSGGVAVKVSYIPSFCFYFKPSYRFLACDQCRKSKCKCERSGPDELCKSCAMLGTRES